MSVRSRHSLPQRLDGALGDPALIADPTRLFSLLRSNAPLYRQLLRATDLQLADGRHRIPGYWGLMFMAYVVCGHRDMKWFYLHTPRRVWRAAGFTEDPSYHTMYRAFCRLEERIEPIRAVVAELIALAVTGSGGLVGRDIHVDGTEAETNARLIHDCPPGQCPRDPNWKGGGSYRARASKKATSDEARANRHADSSKAPEESKPAVEEQKGRRLKMGGCWYLTSDPEAGVRMYGGAGRKAKKKMWHGYYNHKAIDHYTGAVIAVQTVSASVNEWNSYPELLSAALENLGPDAQVRAVVADKGLSVKSVFQTNTQLGIGTVAPYRKTINETQAFDHDRFDRHGIPACKHCSAPGRFVRFAHNPMPRLWFECTLPTSKGCKQTQTIQCKEEWRYLLPLWRTTEAYHALRNSHENYEARHHQWRDRYLVAGDTTTNRPRRRGLGCQQLRAVMAQLVEWLCVNHQQGWLSRKGPLNQNKPRLSRGAKQLKGLIRSRIANGLHLPRALGQAHAKEIQDYRERKKQGRGSPD